MDRPTLASTPIGHPWTPGEIAERCQAVYGGVAWPGQRPGCAVVLALGREAHFESFHVYALDEFESADFRELVYQCGALDLRWRPGRWLGRRNDAADRLIYEMNQQNRDGRRRFYLSSSALCEMQQPYQYFLPELRCLLDPQRRQLFLKDSRLDEHLKSVKPDEDLARLEFGEYPAIEALALAAIELRDHGARPVGPPPRAKFDLFDRDRFQRPR